MMTAPLFESVHELDASAAALAVVLGESGWVDRPWDWDPWKVEEIIAVTVPPTLPLRY